LYANYPRNFTQQLLEGYTDFNLSLPLPLSLLQNGGSSMLVFFEVGSQALGLVEACKNLTAQMPIHQASDKYR
jgi:hypothetical protein